ncbi:MAG TPA: hypothetical protein VME46_09535, partial [Acidimicrobiales bacterium]|nr:hypothetical protein [Acidimicrobiales bacterium]
MGEPVAQLTPAPAVTGSLQATGAGCWPPGMMLAAGAPTGYRRAYRLPARLPATGAPTGYRPRRL